MGFSSYHHVHLPLGKPPSVGAVEVSVLLLTMFLYGHADLERLHRSLSWSPCRVRAAELLRFMLTVSFSALYRVNGGKKSLWKKKGPEP